MPTGYTAGVQDGTITTFPEFAMQCARAFGALVTMRDDPLDAEIPESFEPQARYYDERIAQAHADLERLYAMTDGDKVHAAAAAWNKHVAGIEEWNARCQQERARYEHMLAQARAWQPPTSNHVELKEFMIQQLEQSIDFDCRERSLGERPRPAMWWLDQVKKAKRDIAYYTEEREKEIQRARERTAWVRHLRSSLEQMGVAS